jgi:hypothetical protein
MRMHVITPCVAPGIPTARWQGEKGAVGWSLEPRASGDRRLWRWATSRQDFVAEAGASRKPVESWELCVGT